MTAVSKSIATIAMVQNFFDHTLLAKLVERGAIRAEDAGEIAAETATWAHELADETDRLGVAITCAAGFERIAEAFKR
jgi:hypothetical protein